MAENDEEPTTCDCNKTKKDKPKFVVPTHIFEEDLLPGCPVIEDLPPRHRRLFYPNINSEESSPYKDFNDQQIKDARTYLRVGPNGTVMSKREFQFITWDTAESATASLVTLLFDNHRGAKHVPIQCTLPPETVEDIIYFVTKRFRCSECRVRSAITPATTLARESSEPFKDYFSQSSD